MKMKEVANPQDQGHTPWEIEKQEYLDHDDHEQPTGWKTKYIVYDGDNRIIFIAKTETEIKYANFMVQAVNAYAANQETIKALVEASKNVGLAFKYALIEKYGPLSAESKDGWKALDALNGIIAQAKEASR